MSEYQYYELLALDRPLTSKQREELRQLSTRAEITATRFTNEYHWGSFRGDPQQMAGTDGSRRRSPPLKEEPAAGLADWIATLPAAEKDKLLTMVADGEGPQVQALLLRRFRGSAPDQNEPAQPARTAARLWTAAGARRTVREESEARARRAEEERAATAKATAYNERLDHLAARAEASWREAENLVETKKPRDYDLAVAQW